MRVGIRVVIVGLFCAVFALGCKNNTSPTYPETTGNPVAPGKPLAATGRKHIEQPPPPPP
jgi:hypothetical protein